MRLVRDLGLMLIYAMGIITMLCLRSYCFGLNAIFLKTLQ